MSICAARLVIGRCARPEGHVGLHSSQPETDQTRPYGTLGRRLPQEWCRQCWGDRYVWLGNAWGCHHIGGFNGCRHECHVGEVWLAAS